MTSLSPKRGHSAFELLVALLLLSVGLLAASGSTLATQRLLGASRTAQRAAITASNRFELLRSNRCAAPATAVALQGGVREEWLFARADSFATLLSDSLTFAAPRRGHTVGESYRSLLPC